MFNRASQFKTCALPALSVWAAGMLTRRNRRFFAAGLLTLSLIIVSAQVHATRSTAAPRDFFLQRLILRPGSQSTGMLKLPTPCTWGNYSIDVIFPGDGTPLDFGMAYHEVRKHVLVNVAEARRCILACRSQR